MTYADELVNKRFIPNMIMKIKGTYFAMRKPDTGDPTSGSDYLRVVSGLTLNPTTIDPFRATTAITTSTVKVIDKAEIVTALFNGDLAYLQGEQVEIWLGRCKGQLDPMDFSEYYKLPITYVNKISKSAGIYTFQMVALQDKFGSGTFQTQTKLGVDILDNTTVITLQSVPTEMPTSGYIKIENEFISYTGISGLNLTGCIRGEFDSIPVGHPITTDVILTTVIEENPIDMLLQLLISPGGTGPYDVLADGAQIDASLIDVAQFEAVRDEFFPTRTFKLFLGGETSLKSRIEDEILFPLGLRLRSNSNGKLGLATVDRNIFEIDAPQITHSTLTANPDWSVDNTKIVNRLRIFWDYDDASGEYKMVSEFTDAASIATYGPSNWLEFNLQAVKASLGGSSIVNDIQLLFLNRFATARPMITVNTQMDASNNMLGDKIDLITSTIPTESGDLNFSSTLEILSQQINFDNGTVRQQLSYTSFSGVRQCFIAPSDVIQSHTSQASVEVGAGRGDNYRVGWKMRLYDEVTRDYVSTQVNKIISVVGDIVIFEDDWVGTLVDSQHRIMFADYDSCVEQQKRFCFVSAGEDPFLDGRDFYQITFG
jgi:hypothetical protein